MLEDTFSHGAADLTLCAFLGDDNLHVYVNLILWEKKKRNMYFEMSSPSMLALISNCMCVECVCEQPLKAT